MIAENNNFKDLGIEPPILKALEEMGFEEPTEVQKRAIPHILNKEDLIVMSKTGSGKTAVFGVSMLQLTDPSEAGPQGLILTPTRELAVQVDSNIKQMAKHLKHRTTAVYGQHNINAEIQSLSRGVSIVTGTPGRVFDHISHGNLKTKHIRFLVLDEADRMLDMGFIDQVVKIIKTIPKDRVTLLFSATIPDEVRRICRDHMKNPVTIEIESQTKTVDTIQQVYYRVERNEKRTQLNRILLTEQPESCIIFCNTRVAVDQVQSYLTRKGYASQSLHGDIPQGKRLKTIQEFKQGEFHLLVATDVAARGIHIDDLSLVINYDVPVEKDSYVHRIGRTGRAGNGGRAISLVTSDDIMSLYEIEEHIGAMIAEANAPTEEAIELKKESAEKWIQANSHKVKPSNAPVRQNTQPRPYSHASRNTLSRPTTQSRQDTQPRQNSQTRPTTQPRQDAQPRQNSQTRPTTQPKPASQTRPASQSKQYNTTQQNRTTERPINTASKLVSSSPRSANTTTRQGYKYSRTADTGRKTERTNNKPVTLLQGILNGLKRLFSR